MKYAAILLASCTFLISIACIISPFEAEMRTEWPTFKEYQMQWEGYDRSYWLYKPSNWKLKKPTPVLFAIHGGGGDAQAMYKGTDGKFNQLANEHGFLVVYPNGIERQWNDGRFEGEYEGIAHQTAWKENLDDVGFLINILNQLKETFEIDHNRVFACGISNGGFMTNRLLCERSDIFKAGGVITATVDVAYLPLCQPSQPVGVIVMNGTADTAVPYDGGPLNSWLGSRGNALSTNNYIEFWTKHNACQTASETLDLPDTDGDGTHVSIVEYQNCNNRGKVKLYTIHEGGHTWPGDVSPLYSLIAGKTSMEINACEEIWNFFQSL